ncbi:MAG: group III truncated hemoglobin [Flavobacterium sp.]|nr:group III truncated hemoglobin [Flavobacterium sp.]
MTDISTREDVGKVVRAFYNKVRADETLGPIFNSMIDDWEEHLEKLTDFWTMTLFGGRSYGGNPITAHQEVDEKVASGITPYHFGTWLNLWFATLEELFSGENAETLKRRARKMQTFLMIAIFENRQKKGLL